MMTNREAIEWFKKRRDSSPMAGARKMFDMAVSALEKQEQDRWIPVTERKPEEIDEVLTTYINNGNRKKRYVETSTYYTDDDEGTWSSLWDEYRVPGTAVEVLAWRPLPAPYQEEKA